LNARTIRRVSVSSDMLTILGEAARLHRLTGGVFDPAILPDLEASGYDRSFELITEATEAPLPALPVRGFGAVELDHEGRAVMLPHGMRLDLGGLGKGWAVDRVAGTLVPCGDFLVNAGGDLFARGSDGHHGGWRAAIEHPQNGTTISTVVLRNQALATSTTSRRNWPCAGERRHHLIDPRTGACSRSGVTSVSVIAGSTVEADVFAKTALILGSTRGRAFLKDVASPGLFVLDDGSVQTTNDWPTESSTEGGAACNDAWR
jgi:thiamine biosynthesis lipoprotein